MTTDGSSFDQWIDEGRIPQRLRSPQHLAVLQAAFAFLRVAGDDYASRRIVAHFLLHCGLDWKIAQIARLVSITRPTASRQNKLSSREVVQEIQHRLSGRPYGKLLPRYAGPIAQFLFTRKDATRSDLLDFIESTWNIRVSFPSLHAFLKKYGLDRPSLEENRPAAPPTPHEDERALIEVLEIPPTSGLMLPPPTDDFFLDTPATRAPSC